MYRSFETYRILLVMVSLLVCSFFVWAKFTEIDQQVHGTGRVITSGKIRTIQHLEDGLVKEILVKEGQSVQAGDILFRLTNVSAESEMKEISVSSSALMIRRLRLEAERDSKKVLVFEKDIIAGNEETVKSEEHIFLARKAELEGKLKGLQKRIKQKTLKLDDLSSTVKNLKEERSISQEQLSIKNKLYKSGAVSRSQYLDAQSTVRSFDTKISKAMKEIPIIRSERSEIENILEEAKQGWRSNIVEELNAVNLDINKFNERIVTSSDAVSRTAIRAPINGIVNKLHVNTIGGVIQSGQVLAEIIPVKEMLVIEGEISTVNRGKIWLGLPVAVNVTAYDYSIYGSLQGLLTYISADSFVDEQGYSYYQVRITLENTMLSEDKPIISGMSVDLNVLAGKISVLRALLRPLDQIRENALREI